MTDQASVPDLDSLLNKLCAADESMRLLLEGSDQTFLSEDPPASETVLRDTFQQVLAATPSVLALMGQLTTQEPPEDDLLDISSLARVVDDDNDKQALSPSSAIKAFLEQRPLSSFGGSTTAPTSPTNSPVRFSDSGFLGSLFSTPPEPTLFLPKEIFQSEEPPNPSPLSTADSESLLPARPSEQLLTDATKHRSFGSRPSSPFLGNWNGRSNRGTMSFQKAQCFKTRQCRFWLDGRCTRGDECTFAHCGAELREKPNLLKTKICAKWRQGHCFKPQAECSYAHGLEDLRVLPSAQLSPGGASRAASFGSPLGF
eukprot:Blabericola_migrator_1__7501@NODE_382_length_9143_cov_306_926399_g305_i0_p5_GENE_NODE_382_length_9143_cov_306_926399_g305_i0NODE_382_length_9143_cov_306_926399_g305_i0_p5_ORF_typecomplete_len314_score38_61zfCCCH_3/PF15663_5/4_2e10zf_CCCH_4/PF18345_1/3_8e09zf_CCCH_4/PF18345_1/3_8e03zf_CCCH_4/PF18345_1/2_3e03zfCCCH/PF00642_24/4_1e06zfCCCH/PF00642_24/0_065zfCCCH_4/PF18044_1/8_5e07zfCCCH_4/PF18044_1/2_5e03Torus/PF16131_5/0_01Torus/PF16131_5/0_94zfCCCH_2/PF14608_6/0_00029zfCCCH_2/PF14608_6/86_NODE_38